MVSQDQYNAARMAGYSPDEINAYVQSKQGGQQIKQQQQGSSTGTLQKVSGFLNSMGLGALPEIAGGAFEAGRALDSATGGHVAKAYGNQNDYIGANGADLQNPFLTQKNLTEYSNPMGAIGKTTQNVAGLASYAVPFGKGTSLFGKAVEGFSPIKAGVMSGTLQGASQNADNVGQYAQNIGANAALGGLGAGVTSGIFKLLGGTNALGGQLKNVSDAITRSQYKVSPTEAAKEGLPAATKLLADNYGLYHITDVNNAAQKVTGENGLITQLTHEAVNKADPVDLGGLNHIVNQTLNENIYRQPHEVHNFLEYIKNGINYAEDGSDIVKANPSKVYEFIKALESKGAQNYQSPDIAKQEWGKTYFKIASELKDRLFGGYTNPNTNEASRGADAMLNEMIQNGTVADRAKSLGIPQLEKEMQNVKDVSHLRSLAHPFVSTSIAADKTANRVTHQVINPTDLLAGLIGIHGFGPFGGAGLMAAEKAANSNAGKAGLGEMLNKSGNVLQKSPNISQGARGVVNATAARTPMSLYNLLNQQQ